MTKKIIIIGASGLIGEAVLKLLSGESKHELVIFSSKAGESILSKFSNFKIKADNLKELRTLCLELKPDIIINAASYADPFLCEKNKQIAWNLNAALIENLASVCRIIDAHLIFFSTDCIFDGKSGPYTENINPNPINYFGKTKHSAENFCHTNLQKCTIIRTVNPFGITSFNKCDFFRKLLNDNKSEVPIKMPFNYLTNFTYTEDIARSVFKIIEKERYGIFNVVSPDYLSFYEAAKLLFKIYCLDSSKIEAIEPKQWMDKVRYPVNGGLINLKAETCLGIKFTSLENSLTTYKYLQSLEMKDY